MDKKLFFQAIIKFLFGFVIVGGLIFLPAGTFNFWNGWLLMGLLFIPMFIAGIVLMIKKPELLRKRLNAKESKKDQQEIITYSALMFIIGFIVAGLDYRFQWKEVPLNIVIFSAVVFVFAYVLYALVLKENEYLSRTIEIQQGQKLVDTGLYAIVRHPMYSASILLFLSMPLILGSIYSFIIFLIYPYLISRRIKTEEEMLINSLPGYREYRQRVKYKVIPFIW